MHVRVRTYPLPGLFGLFIAPITASVARVAFSGSDSNHLSNTYYNIEIHNTIRRPLSELYDKYVQYMVIVIDLSWMLGQ